MIIDLRSDTVTKPTPEMMEAMFKAEVGDDVFNEDPTIIALEQKTAKLFGMEAGLFCPSGTMTNQLAIKTHTKPGDEVLCDVNSHIYHYEVGGMAFHSGVQAKLLQGTQGIINASLIEANINGYQDWLTQSTLVSLENTVNKAGGSYYKLTEVEAISKVTHNHGLKLHIDGARIFNALIETNESAVDYGKYIDSMSVCLSKGLGAPVGSVLLGDSEFIKKSRRYRKLFGGGMRQAGILAAAGIYALDHHVSRLKEDHINAKAIETILNKLPYIESIEPVYTNIVIFKIKDSVDAVKFQTILNENGIKCAAFGKQIIRFVTHLDFKAEMLNKLEDVLKSIS